MSHVFISYVRNNRRKVQRLYNELTNHGVKIWLDRNDIAPGTDWQQAIRRAIQDGAFFIACFSEQYSIRQKTFMNEELVVAIEELRQRTTNEAWFIPVKLNRCEIPDLNVDRRRTLKNLNYIELYREWNSGIQSILDVIQPIPANVQKLIETLDSDDDFVRSAAFMALVKKGHHAAIPALIQTLKHRDERIRISASRALETLTDIIEPAAIPPIVEALMPAVIDALNDRNSEVRQHVAYALWGLEYSKAAPALRQVLKDENPLVCMNAVSALGNIKDPMDVPALIELLSDDFSDDLVRILAARALKNIGTLEALKAVAEYEKQKTEN